MNEDKRMTLWYEKCPDLLEKEKALMNSYYPQFTLDKLEDGRLCWIGEIKSPFNNRYSYTLMVVYMSNHPYWKMGSSIRIYMIEPDGKVYCGALGPEDTPFDLCSQTCMDSNGSLFQAVWIHGQESPYSAAKELSHYLAWMFIRECQIESNTPYPIDWMQLKRIYPFLDTTIKE